MPTVPRISEDRIRQQPISTQRRTAGTTEETFGGGQSTQRALSAAGDLFDTSRRMLIDQWDRANRLKNAEAEIELQKADREGLTELTRLKGVNAINARETIIGQYDKRAQEIEKGLVNGAQKQAFRQKLAERRSLFEFNVSKYVSAEIDKATTDFHEARLVNANEEAKTHAFDTVRLGVISGQKREWITQYGKDFGIPGQVIDQQVRESDAEVYKNAIYQALSVEPKAALELLDDSRVRAAIPSKDLVTIKNSIQASITKNDKIDKAARKIEVAKNEATAIVKLNNGTLTHQELEQMTLNLDIGSRLANTLFKALNNPNTSEVKTDPQTYFDLFDRLLNPDEDREQLRIDLVQAVNDRKLSVTDSKKLYGGIEAGLYGETLAEMLGSDRQAAVDEFNRKDEEQKERKMFLLSALTAIKNKAVQLGNSGLSMARSFLDRINDNMGGPEIVKKADEVMEEEVSKSSDIASFKEGDKVTNPATGEVFEIIGFNEAGKAVVKKISKDPNA